MIAANVAPQHGLLVIAVSVAEVRRVGASVARWLRLQPCGDRRRDQ